MANKRLNILYLVAAVLIQMAALSCSKNDEVHQDGREHANLSISVMIPKISLATKSNAMPTASTKSNAMPMAATKSNAMPMAAAGSIVSDPFGDKIDQWKEYEKLIDGRSFYRLTLFLINKETEELAGYRDIYEGSSEIKGSADTDYGANGFLVGNKVIDTKYASQAVVNFRYDFPLHNISSEAGSNSTPTSPEQLVRGTYRLIAIANWSAVDIEIEQGGTTTVESYEGITDHNGNANLKDFIQGIIDEFKAQTPGTTKKFKDYKNYHDFMDYTLHTDIKNKQYLCQIAPQPLVIVQDFALNPGENYLTAQLKRTWARIRVVVENISNKELTIHSLSFGDNTTKDESFMFYAPGNGAATLGKPNGRSTYGAPKVTAETGLDDYDALVSFTPGTKIQGFGEEGTQQQNTMVLFDGYILDCDGKGNDGNGELFSYDIDLEYEGKKTYHLTRKKRDDGSWDIIEDHVDDIEDGGLYVLQSRRNSTKVVMYAGDNTVENDRSMLSGSGFIKDDITEFQEEFVFRFVRDTDTPDQEVNKRQGGKEISPVQKVTFPRYWIQTYDGKYWLGTPTQEMEKIKLIPENPTAYLVRNDGFFASWPGSNILFQSTVEDPNRTGIYNYMNVNGKDSKIINGWFDGKGGDGKIYPGDDDGSQWQMTKVVQETRDARFSGTVTLATTDPVTAVSSNVTSIKRNDFINIYITASYAEHTGEFKFEVKDWDEKSFDFDLD